MAEYKSIVPPIECPTPIFSEDLLFVDNSVKKSSAKVFQFFIDFLDTSHLNILINGVFKIYWLASKFNNGLYALGGKPLPCRK